MIYLTGNTHGDFSRFSLDAFPEQEYMTTDGYVRICGDFGGIWCGDERDDKALDALEQLPFTVLFVSGNHEDFLTILADFLSPLLPRFLICRFVI